MRTITDLGLLQEYAARGSEEAFRTLVERYTGLVYSAALRQTGNTHTAEDITQVVFIILARKAGALPRTTVLAGWLLHAARFVALNALRREARRQQIERETISLRASGHDNAWDRIAPVLDEALFNLSKRDRDAIALRFFDQRSFREIGEITGTTEDNAQKRVSRAVVRLRGGLARRGVQVPAALAIAAISAGAVQAAPSHLAALAASGATTGGVAGGEIRTWPKRRSMPSGAPAPRRWPFGELRPYWSCSWPCSHCVNSSRAWQLLPAAPPALLPRNAELS